MLSVLNNRTYRHLFTAQVIALVGTGLMTVALGLLAYELAGADAGAVLGAGHQDAGLRGVAPVAQAFADRLPAALAARGAGPRASGRRAVPALRHRGLADLPADLRSAGGIRRLHADLPGHHPGHPSRRRGLHEGAVAVPAGLRPGKPDFPDAGRRAADRHQLSQPVRGNGARFPRFSRSWSARLPTSVPGPRRGIWERTTRGTRIYLATPRLRACWRSAWPSRRPARW